jgi:hypothetical protein
MPAAPSAPAGAPPQGPPPVLGNPDSCYIVLEHMFDPAKCGVVFRQCFFLFYFIFYLTSDRRETEPGWEADIRDEVHEECARHAPVFHIAVDAASPAGLVYLKLRSPPLAGDVVKRMHGRFFAGQMITARFLTEREYLGRYPDAAAATIALPAPA